MKGLAEDFLDSRARHVPKLLLKKGALLRSEVGG